MALTSSSKVILLAGVAAGLFFFVNRAYGSAGALAPVNVLGEGSVKLTDEQKTSVALITDKANQANINPAFMVALAVTESSLKPRTIGDDGKSLGLFQLTLDTVHYWNPTYTQNDLLDGPNNADMAMLDMRKYFTDFPGFTYGDYAEAWTLGETGRFRRGLRNPQKVQHLQQAISDLGLTLNLNEVPL